MILEWFLGKLWDPRNPEHPPDLGSNQWFPGYSTVADPGYRIQEAKDANDAKGVEAAQEAKDEQDAKDARDAQGYKGCKGCE